MQQLLKKEVFFAYTNEERGKLYPFIIRIRDALRCRINRDERFRIRYTWRCQIRRLEVPPCCDDIGESIISSQARNSSDNDERNDIDINEGCDNLISDSIITPLTCKLIFNVGIEKIELAKERYDCINEVRRSAGRGPLNRKRLQMFGITFICKEEIVPMISNHRRELDLNLFY